MTQSRIAEWFCQYLTSLFQDFTVESCSDSTKHLSGYSETLLKGFPESSFWDFKTDVFAVLSDKSGIKKLALLNFSKKTLGLTELGELHVYSKLCSPIFALQLSERGLSRDLYSLLMDPNIEARLLSYGGLNRIVVAQWDAERHFAIPGSCFPIVEDSPFEKALSVSSKYK